MGIGGGIFAGRNKAKSCARTHVRSLAHWPLLPRTFFPPYIPAAHMPCSPTQQLSLFTFPPTHSFSLIRLDLGVETRGGERCVIFRETRQINMSFGEARVPLLHWRVLLLD